MRDAFAQRLTKLAKKDSKIFLLSGDIGNKLFDKFKSNFPNRFINCGIAENNMIGVAAGLAKEGYKPFVYTITPFLTSRSFEQIRLDVGCSNLNVYIVGTGSGLSYSRLGPTHHSLEDLALMQSIPNLEISIPGDPYEIEEILSKVIKKNKPHYIRLGKKNKTRFLEKYKTKYNKINCLLKGKKIAIISLGPIVEEAFKAIKMLEIKGIKPSLYSINHIKPFDFKNLSKKLKSYNKIFILEEHYEWGGFASRILDSQEIKNFNIIKIAIRNKFYNGLGEQSEARKFLKIDSRGIYNKILGYETR